jgi:2,3-bisphosphoglycerate-independent phosphoglycerate mutase
MDAVTKGIIIIGDGLGDRPVAEFGNRTPLEAATTPNLDRVATEGECGLMDPISPGIRAGSDTAHLSILGYDPRRTYTGRGPFEALGIGMEVRHGDVCFRCNFSTVDENMVIIDRRAGRISEGTAELAAAINGMVVDGVTCYFKESVEHRAALVLRGEGLGSQVTDADPHEAGEKVPPADGPDDASRRTARVVNAFVAKSYEILRQHPVNVKRVAEGKPPANIALPRGAGIAPELEPFEHRYGLTGAMVVEVGLVKGLGRYLQMDVIDVAAATGGYDTDEIALGRAAVEALGRHRFALCNLKAPDLAGHDADFQKKVATEEKLDRLVGEVLRCVDEHTFLVVTGDHCTPIGIADHSGDAVPIMFWGPGVRTDAAKRFDERSVTAGGLGRIRGGDVMNILTSLMNTQVKFGA